MIEKALGGTRRYWIWIVVLLAVIGAGTLVYLRQFQEGLTVTGLSRDVPWGFYIAQFTFLVGVAASAVMVVLPYYLHDYKAFGKLTVLGEFLAIAAVCMCMLFIFVDMGYPTRVLNIALHPTLNSLMFWDMVVMMGYLVLNVVISRVTFSAEQRKVAPPRWIKPLIILSIPWAVSIHTVTAFLYSGLAARPFWMTAILAPRFLATAFAAGPALLILICLLVRRFTGYDVGREALKKLGVIVAYAMSINLFFILLELFTVGYSDIPEHLEHLKYMYFGVGGQSTLWIWMWASGIIGLFSLVLLLVPKLRTNETLLALACVAVVVSIWIEKGMSMVVVGFVPNPFHEFTEYAPSASELTISLGIYAVGILILTGLLKVALDVRKHKPKVV